MFTIVIITLGLICLLISSDDFANHGRHDPTRERVPYCGAMTGKPTSLDVAPVGAPMDASLVLDETTARQWIPPAFEVPSALSLQTSLEFLELNLASSNSSQGSSIMRTLAEKNPWGEFPADTRHGQIWKISVQSPLGYWSSNARSNVDRCWGNCQYYG